MKISEFAKHFDTSKSTIRYFTEINLLIPSLKGTYPDYDKKCEADMKDIMAYKNMGFSNVEIKELKYYERFFLNNNPICNTRIQKIFNEKITEIESIIKKHKLQIESIKVKSSNLDVIEATPIKGIHINVLSELICPFCKETFNIINGSIIDSHLFSGDLKCSCGINFMVSKGVLISNDISVESFEIPPESLDIPYSSNVSNKMLSLLRKCGHSLDEELNAVDHSHGIVFLNVNVNLFLMDVLKNFKDNGKYFFCVQSRNLLNITKYIIESENPKGNITLLYSTKAFPINSSDKCFVDVFSVHQDFHMDNPPGTISNVFMHDDSSNSLVFNISSPNVSESTSIYYKNVTCNKIYESYGYSLKSETLIGSVPPIKNEIAPPDDIYFKVFK